MTRSLNSATGLKLYVGVDDATAPEHGYIGSPTSIDYGMKIHQTLVGVKMKELRICLTRVDSPNYGGNQPTDTGSRLQPSKADMNVLVNKNLNEESLGQDPDSSYASTVSSNDIPETKVAHTSTLPSSTEMHENIYQCTLCPSKFQNKSNLRRHNIQIHSTEKTNPYRCESCGKGFPYKFRLIRHNRTHETDRAGKFKCDYCNRSYDEKNLLKNHVLTHIGTKEFECPNCNKLFLTKANLRCHLLTHTKEKAFKCSKCNREFSLTGNRRRHENNAHKLTCSQCDLRFVRISDLDEHKYKLSEHGERGYQHSFYSDSFPVKSDVGDQTKLVNKKKLHQCTKCGVVFAQLNNLRRHVLTNVHARAGEFKCENCSKIFRYKSELKAHAVTHKISKDFKCPNCSKFFLTESRLQAHVLTHAKKTSTVCAKCNKEFSKQGDRKKHENRVHTHSCQLCDLCFVKRTDLNKHNREHGLEHCQYCKLDYPVSEIKQHLLSHGGSLSSKKTSRRKKHCCTLCEKYFLTETTLMYHIATHTGEKLAKCGLCDKRFRSKTSLRFHINTHTKEKKFTCQICGKELCRKSTFQLHVMSHNQKKNHTCMYCSKGFVTKGMLEEHLRSHTGEQPFSCHFPNCGQRFRIASVYRKHKETHNGNRKLFSCTFCNDGKLYLYSAFHMHRKSHKMTVERHYCEYEDCSFSSIHKSYVNSHVRVTHLEEKTHVCSFCNKSFFATSSLRQHVKIHIGEGDDNKHPCEYCKKEFPRKDLLLKHTRRAHPGLGSQINK